MRKIVSLGKYSMEGEILGSGSFARVELAVHKYTKIKVLTEAYFNGFLIPAGMCGNWTMWWLLLLVIGSSS